MFLYIIGKYYNNFFPNMSVSQACNKLYNDLTIKTGTGSKSSCASGTNYTISTITGLNTNYFYIISCRFRVHHNACKLYCSIGNDAAAEIEGQRGDFWPMQTITCIYTGISSIPLIAAQNSSGGTADIDIQYWLLEIKRY